MNRSIIKKFFNSESAPGICLFTATIMAVTIFNSPLNNFYHHFLEYKLGPLSLHYWINDGLMAIFFFLVGMEIKNEMIKGKLSTIPQIMTPAIAALGGVIFPAVIFFLINSEIPENLSGWAIPTATDIAFAVGILILFGSRVSVELKVLLISIAVLDDLMAILIIALFYSSGISILYLSLSSIIVIALFTLNQLNVRKITPYMILGFILWVLIFKSGIHATIAGVILAFTIPLRTNSGIGGIMKPFSDKKLEYYIQPISGVYNSPLKKLEYAISPYVNFFILPLFAFANAGVSLSGLSLSKFTEPLVLGIILGLFFGKQIGITLFVFIFSKLKVCRLPHGISIFEIYGIAVLAGIGFTMSLFIGDLAFDSASHLDSSIRIGVLTASFFSAIFGALIIHIIALKKNNKTTT